MSSPGGVPGGGAKLALRRGRRLAQPWRADAQMESRLRLKGGLGGGDGPRVGVARAAQFDPPLGEVDRRGALRGQPGRQGRQRRRRYLALVRLRPDLHLDPASAAIRAIAAASRAAAMAGKK